jgi:hypothetical protein
MRAVVLDAAEQGAFATAALSLKYEPDPVRPAPVTASQLLEVRRSADGGADLWSTFNRVQEALVTGGLRGRRADGGPMRTRPVQGIDANLKLNRALWDARRVDAAAQGLRPGGASAPPVPRASGHRDLGLRAVGRSRGPSNALPAPFDADLPICRSRSRAFGAGRRGVQ